MRLLTLSVNVFLMFQRALHRAEYHRASSTIVIFFGENDTRPMSTHTILCFHNHVNGFDKTFFHLSRLIETDVMFPTVTLQQQQ